MTQDHDHKSLSFFDIDGICEYFAQYDYAQELEVAKRIKDFVSQRPVDQQHYDDLLEEIGRCDEGSMISATWWWMRHWGLSMGLMVPPREAFPWGKHVAPP